MDPNLPPQTSSPAPEPSVAPEPQTVAPAPPLEHDDAPDYDVRKAKLKLTWGLVLLIAPTVFFFIYITLCVVGFLIDSSAVLNILIYTFALLWLITAIPGLVIGIVLIATRKK